MVWLQLPRYHHQLLLTSLFWPEVVREEMGRKVPLRHLEVVLEDTEQVLEHLVVERQQSPRCLFLLVVHIR